MKEYKFKELTSTEIEGFLKKMSKIEGFKPISMTTLGAGVTVGFSDKYIIYLIYEIKEAKE